MFNFIPDDIENIILSYLTSNTNINKIVKYSHFIKYKNSLNFINKNKLNDFLISKFTHFYNATSRQVTSKSGTLVYARHYGLKVSYNGDIIPGNGRFYGFGILFCLGNDQIFNLKITDKYNTSKKQKIITFIIKQIINSD